jgi:chemotaxis methyl-accepting protein methylase
MKENFGLTDLIDYIFDRFQINLFLYSFRTIRSAFLKRLQDLNLPNFKSYIGYMEDHPDEGEILNLNYILRLPESELSIQDLTILKSKLLSYIRSEKKKNIKIWVPSFGREKHFLWISCLCEGLVSKSILETYSIYITNPDTSRIQEYRKIFIALEEIPSYFSDWLESFFDESETNPGKYELKPHIRKHCIFKAHSLPQDIPPAHIDFCILGSDLDFYSYSSRKKIIRIFHYALSPRAILFSRGQFPVIDQDQIFQQTSDSKQIFVNLKTLTKGSTTETAPINPGSLAPYSEPERLKELYFNSLNLSYLIVDDLGQLYEISENLLPLIKFVEGRIEQSIYTILGPEIAAQVMYLVDIVSGSGRPESIPFETVDTGWRGRFNSIYCIPQRENQNRKFFAVYFENKSITENNLKKEILETAIKEIHHRMKNHMTVIFSILDLEENFVTSSEAKSSLKNLSYRIRALQMIQEEVSLRPLALEYEISPLIKEYIGFLSTGSVSYSQRIHIQYEANGSPALLQAKQITSLLLAINEITLILLSSLNPEEPGNLEISLNSAKSQLAVRVKLRYTDSNLNRSKKDSDFSEVLLDANLHQLNGTITEKWGSEFSEFEILLSL